MCIVLPFRQAKGKCDLNLRFDANSDQFSETESIKSVTTDQWAKLKNLKAIYNLSESSQSNTG